MTSQNAGRQAVIDTTRTIHFGKDVYGNEEAGLLGWFVMVSDPVSMLHGGPEWDEVGGPFPTKADAEAHAQAMFAW